MRIQAAIDRVSVSEAEKIISVIYDLTDIIEIGTSLIKEYGLKNSVGVLKERYPDVCLLGDIKTCDEGAYEFEKCYEAGADIATVMGFSSLETITACARVARTYQKEYFIDLLEVDDEKLLLLKDHYPDAIFGVHLPSDKDGNGLGELVKHMCGKLDGVKKIAVAGGVKPGVMKLMKQCGVDIVIAGSAITKAEDIRAAAQFFYKAAHEQKEVV